MDEPTCSTPPIEFDEARDLYDSYYAAVAEMRRRLLAGEPLPPEWMPKWTSASATC